MSRSRYAQLGLHMLDQANRIENMANAIPSQDVCARLGCGRPEWVHYDEKARVERGACQNYLPKGSN